MRGVVVRLETGIIEGAKYRSQSIVVVYIVVSREYSFIYACRFRYVCRYRV